MAGWFRRRPHGQAIAERKPTRVSFWLHCGFRAAHQSADHDGRSAGDPRAPKRGALAASEPDPIFAAIEHHRQAWETLKSAPHDDDQMRLHEAVLVAESEVVNIRPTTTAGAVALRAYHREHRYRERMYPTPFPGEYRYWGKG